MFTRREVVRSFRKFRDLSGDLHRASFPTWEECLRHLISHCQNDVVMKVVTEPLRTHPNVDLKKWHGDFLATGSGGGIGTYRYSLPTDDDERTALLYQFLVAVTENKFDYFSFSVSAYGSRGGRDAIGSLNTEIVGKFTREVAYRLEEIETDLGETGEIESSALMVFNYHGPVQNFQGAVQNIEGGVHGGVAAQNSTVTDNSIIYNDRESFAAAVNALVDGLTDVLDDHRESVSGAFALLIKAIETNTAPKPVEVATAVQAINDGSPSGLARLKGIMDGAAGNVLGDLLTPLFAYYCGVSNT